ncbi:L-lactate MFS transporter [Carboxylicivirga sp. N1Y90]|uniref:L-lactate MFS transporter n=1 Tax=Carboxylicivirga fragile TaxID=3417571 RepID=UPI003D3461A3|nr:OFA family MFS transporter [Marinilabiliaceae bacterium N1Y90]
MSSNKLKNRWFIALAGVGIHMSIGSIYAWSKLGSMVENQISAAWSLQDITTVFSIAIFFLGVSAAFMGKVVERKGPRFTGTVASIFFGTGVFLGGVALKMENLYLLYATYGMIGGIGLGMGYVTPVSTMVKWFPDRRGLATGMAIMGFGLGAAIQIYLIKSIFPLFGITSISSILMILGPVYGVLMFSSAQYLEKPPVDWLPEGYNPDEVGKNGKAIKKDLSNITANQSLKTARFYFLWAILFINVTSGIALISVANSMGREIVMLSVEAAAVLVMLMSMFNAFGRLAWSTLSDYIGRPATYISFFVIQIAAFYYLTTFFGGSISDAGKIGFQVAFLIILTCYGGGFATVPAFIGDLFGTKELGAIHGYILTAWALAGIVGPQIISYLKDTTGSYQVALYYLIGFLFLGLVSSILLILNTNKLRKQQVETEELKMAA